MGRHFRIGLPRIALVGVGLALLAAFALRAPARQPASEPARSSGASTRPSSSPFPQTNPDLRTLWVVGDSTAANNTRTPDLIQGWGTPFLTYFDTSKINVVNAARGG